MAAADDTVLLRRLISESAHKHGLRATFMAKPFLEWPGNGMHVHASVLDNDGNNIFAGEAGDLRLQHAAAGLLETLKDTLLLYIPGFNGYRRLQPGSYAPTRIAWGAKLPPPPVEGNAYKVALPQLSDDMDDAIEDFERSDFILRLFGAELRGIFAEIKREELKAFDNEITPLERSTYL